MKDALLHKSMILHKVKIFLAILVFLLSVGTEKASAQRTVGETVWTWWSSSADESKQYVKELAETGFDNLTFSMTHLYHSSSWDFKDGDGAVFSDKEKGRLDLISDAWISNRVRQMDIAHEAGLKVNVIPVWIGMRMDEVVHSGDASSIMDNYCGRLKEAGLWTHPALNWVIFGGDYYKGQSTSEEAFVPAWLECRKHIPESIRVGYHNGTLSSAINTIHETGVADFIFLQTGHKNEWPEAQMIQLIDKGIAFEWGENIYPEIDIVQNNGSECASQESLLKAFENGIKYLDHFSHFQYGHNDRHQNSDGDGGREEAWHCHSGDSATESVVKHRDFERALIEKFKAN